MREKLKVAGAFLIGLSVASSVTYAQLGGRGRNVAFVDGTAISPSSVTTTGDVTANGDLTVGADNTDSKVCFDGPACVNKIDVTQSNDFMTAWSNNTGVWTATPSFFYVYKQVMAQQPVVSLMASGSQSFSCANLGCRLNLGSTARYLFDDGNRLSTSGDFVIGNVLRVNNVIQQHVSGVSIAVVGRPPNNASAVGVIADTDVEMTTAGAKLLSVRTGTIEKAFIDKDGAYTGLSCNATATSGSSFTGGNSSTSLTMTSNTTDAVTSSTVPAIRLQASQNITDTDLLMSVEDSAGNRRMTLTEVGDMSGLRDLTVTRYLFGTHAQFSASFTRAPNAISIPDSGGAGAASYTWVPTTLNSLTHFTCNDPDGCDITLSETGKGNGEFNRATNIGTNNITFTDTAGVTEMNGNFTAGQWDTIEFVYTVDRFVEVSRSNN